MPRDRVTLYADCIALLLYRRDSERMVGSMTDYPALTYRHEEAVLRDYAHHMLFNEESEESFEALLLEVLADYQVTIPEIGTIRAQVPPLVILTSNNTRELGDALKRRCLHLHIGYPDAVLEQKVLRARVPGLPEALLAQLVAFIQLLRVQNIRKPPSMAESVDWARTLVLLHATALDETLVRDTLNVLLKRESDIVELQDRIPALARAAVIEPA